MDIVTVRFQEGILKRMDKSIAEHNYNSRTEFIRDAIRDKLDIIKKEELINKFLSLRGSMKRKAANKDDEKLRQEFSKELMERLDKRFS